jgi:hypothetical protein
MAADMASRHASVKNISPKPKNYIRIEKLCPYVKAMPSGTIRVASAKAQLPFT